MVNSCKQKQDIFGKNFNCKSCYDINCNKSNSLEKQIKDNKRVLKREKWSKATSPYLLKDQDLKSLIKVKAIDKSGNSRIEIFKPEFKISAFYIVWIILIILALGVIFWLIKIRKYKK